MVISRRFLYLFRDKQKRFINDECSELICPKENGLAMFDAVTVCILIA